jgi:tetratricopeptide (TPR) repeat protein
MSPSKIALGLVACLAAPAPRVIAAQTSDAPVCENRGGQASPGARVAACSAILTSGGLTPGQESMARVNRAWAFSLQGRMADARADYDRAIELNPSSHIVHNERALFYLRSGRLDDAIAEYDTALALDPDAAFSLYGRGLAWLRKGDVRRGGDDLARARRADGNVDEAFRRIGMTP